MATDHMPSDSARIDNRSPSITGVPVAVDEQLPIQTMPESALTGRITHPSNPEQSADNSNQVVSFLQPSSGGVAKMPTCASAGVAIPHASEASSASVVLGWKRRNVGIEGPDTRTPPSDKTAIERRLLKMKDRKGVEIFEPIIGTDFDSCQEAYDFYNLFSWEHGFGIRRAKSRINSNKYRTMHELVCQCAGKNEKENSASCKIECKAMVRLLRTQDHGWYVSAFVNEHNHKLSVGYEEKIKWNSHNHIDPVALNFIKNLRGNNVSVSKVYSILGGSDWNLQAVPYRKQVLRTLCAKFSQETIKDDLTKTMKLLQEMKAEDRNLRVEIDVDGDGRIRTMLWATGKNREDYIYFGDVVTFDTTYKTNLYNMPFGLFVGVNNHFQSIIFGGALMREETEVAFHWVFKTFVSVMNDKHPLTILTDQAIAMKGAIESVLPHTKHRWCKWHVLRDAKGNIGHVYNKFSGFKKEFNKLVNEVLCVDEFETKWSSLVRKFKLGKNEYMERLYDKRYMWAKPYFKGIFCAGMTSTQRSESANHMLKQYIPRSSPMHVFVRQYNKFLVSRKNDEARELHMNANRSRTHESTFPIEDDAASIYTRTVLSKFQDELYKSGSYVVDIVEPGSHFMVSVAPSKVKDAAKRKWRNVKIEDAGQFISCDCGMFDHVGMLCRHALKVLIRDDYLKIPPRNILKRWTKWATGSYPSGMDMTDKDPKADDTSYLKNLLYIAVEELVTESSREKASLEVALEGVGKLTAAIRKANVMNVTVRHGEPHTVQNFVNVHFNTILAPERVKKTGRPSSVRPKSKMDRVASSAKKKNKSKVTTTKKSEDGQKQKERALATLYENDHGMVTPTKASEDEVSPNIPSKKRKVICSTCHEPGHTRLKCTTRGIAQNLFECLQI